MVRSNRRGTRLLPLTQTGASAHTADTLPRQKKFQHLQQRTANAGVCIFFYGQLLFLS